MTVLGLKRASSSADSAVARLGFLHKELYSRRTIPQLRYYTSRYGCYGVYALGHKRGLRVRVRMRNSALALATDPTSIMAKRGSTLCAVCGCSNGNRAEICKKCETPFPKRVKKSAQQLSPQYSIDVSHLLLPESPLEDNAKVYSVRIRNQGPDYRYVQ